jgi:hypothetical protein
VSGGVMVSRTGGHIESVHDGFAGLLGGFERNGGYAIAALCLRDRRYDYAWAMTVTNPPSSLLDIRCNPVLSSRLRTFSSLSLSFA